MMADCAIGLGYLIMAEGYDDKLSETVEICRFYSKQLSWQNSIRAVGGQGCSQPWKYW